MTRISDWTSDRTDILTALWSEGLSASVIGARLGISRSAALGKVYRLGLPPRLVTAIPPAERRERNRRRLAEARSSQKVIAFAPKSERTAPVVVPYLGPLNIPLCSLADLKSEAPNQCRFIEAREPAPLYLCCGRETKPGLSFCAHHFEIVHPTDARRCA